jgi:hypothetical protein
VGVDQSWDVGTSVEFFCFEIELDWVGCGW